MSNYVINPYDGSSDIYPDGTLHVLDTESKTIYSIPKDDMDKQNLFRKAFPQANQSIDEDRFKAGLPTVPNKVYELAKGGNRIGNHFSDSINIARNTPIENPTDAALKMKTPQSPTPTAGTPSAPTQDQQTHQAFMRKFGGGDYLDPVAAETAGITNQFQQNQSALANQMNAQPKTFAPPPGPRTELSGPEAYEQNWNKQTGAGLLNQEQSAIENQVNHQQDMAQQVQAKRDAEQVEFQKQQADQAAFEKKRNDAIQVATSKYNDLAKLADEDKPMPWGFSMDKSIGSNIGTALQIIGSGLLTYGAIKGHGDPSTGIKFIQSQVDNQMASEQQRIQQEEKAAVRQRGMIDTLRENFGDEQAALNAGYALTYHKIGNEIDSLLAQSQSQTAIDNLKMAKVAVAQKENQYQQQMNAESAKVALEGAKTSAEIAAKQSEIMAAKNAGGKDLPQEAINNLSAMKTSDDQVEIGKKLYNQIGWETHLGNFPVSWTIPGTAANKYETWRTNFINSYSKALGGVRGEDSASFKERLEKSIPHSNDVSASSMPKFQSLHDAVRLEYANQIDLHRRSGYNVANLPELRTIEEKPAQ